MIYRLGRSLQLLGLLVMPSAIWAAQFRRDEKAAILIFLSSIFLFAAGYFLARSARS